MTEAAATSADLVGLVAAAEPAVVADALAELAELAEPVLVLVLAVAAGDVVVARVVGPAAAVDVAADFADAAVGSAELGNWEVLIDAVLAGRLVVLERAVQDGVGDAS